MALQPAKMSLGAEFKILQGQLFTLSKSGAPRQRENVRHTTSSGTFKVDLDEFHFVRLALPKYCPIPTFLTSGENPAYASASSRPPPVQDRRTCKIRSRGPASEKCRQTACGSFCGGILFRSPQIVSCPHP